MRKNNNSKRSQNFLKRNSPNFEECRNYIIDLLSAYDINEYEFKNYIDNDLALFVGDFICFIDYNFVELKVLNIKTNDIKIFTKENCWLMAIRLVGGK